jgi:hypothetical protein
VRDPSEFNGMIVHGKEWWDRTAGVSYAAVRVTVWFITGEAPEHVYSSFEAHSYKQMAEEALVKQGWIELETYANGFDEGLRVWANRNGVPLYFVVEEGCTKKDVQRWGIDPGKGEG